MTAIGILITAIIATMCSGVAYDIIDYCIDHHKKKDYEKLDKHEDYIISGNWYNYSGMSNMNKQIVYKVDGDFNGDIKGDNVIVILMGNGDFNGDINSKDGEVVLIRGDVNGDIKANKVLCPTDPNVSDNDDGCTECVWFDGKDKTCAWGVDKKDCTFLQHPKQVKCSDCVHAKRRRECYECSQFNKEVDDNYRNCQLYKSIRHNEDSLASPYERMDFIYDGDKCVNRYKSLVLANVTCPHCRKSFSKNLRVVTTVVDGEVSNTEIQNYGGYFLD